MNNTYFRVVCDVDLDAIRSNISKLQQRLKTGTRSCAVIKADGYGHGAVPIARNIEDLVDFFAVATIDEALKLRQSDIEKPILVIGYVDPESASLAIQNDIRLTVFDINTAKCISEAAARSGKNALIHIKIDTGMSRIGYTPSDDSLKEIIAINNLPNIAIEGVFTHFFASDEKDKSKAYAQLDLFKSFANKIKSAAINIKIFHCSNSAAATDMPEANMDMVRLGISIYGLYPSDDVRSVTLTPAMSLKSHVVMVKDLPKGRSIGYGGTFTARHDMRIATIPVGYADGYMRGLSNKGYVLIHGAKAPIVGRVCMDQMMVDVTGIEDVRQKDEVVLIGRQLGNVITLEEISTLAGSFNYEFACDINPRVPRRYFSEGRQVGFKDYFDEHY